MTSVSPRAAREVTGRGAGACLGKGAALLAEDLRPSFDSAKKSPENLSILGALRLVGRGRRN